MNHSLLNTEIQEFISHHLNSNLTSLILKKSNYLNVDIKEIIVQIEAKNKCEKKLPTWFYSENIYYAPKLNLEQTSSETTSNYKSKIVSGDSIIDLTGGFGVDCFSFAKVFKQVTHCEINTELSEIAQHNFKQLKISNVSFLALNGLEYLKQYTNSFDWIYLDPSRRNDSKGKVFFLNDCLPNVVTNIDLLFKYSNNILIKTSPLLDISIGIQELKFVKQIHVVAVKNEVKELLWILEHNFNGEISIKTVNLKNYSNEVFEFTFKQEKNAEATLSSPQLFLYEPNSAILKAGAFNTIAKRLNVFKLNKHAHLYTNKSLINFPGRCFKISDVLMYNKKEIKKLKISQANITTRHFPESVESIRKKFQIKDGGHIYLFFTTDLNDNKIVIRAEKLD